MNYTAVFFSVLVSLNGFLVHSLAQNASSEPPKSSNTVHGSIAAKFQFATFDEEELRRIPKAILNYSNPVRARGQSGSIYLWTVKDRPAVIGSVWSIRDSDNMLQRKVSIELHTLLGEPLAATSFPKLDGATQELPEWKPPRIEGLFQEVEGVPISRTTRPLLKAAARRLANRFSVNVLDNKTREAWPLRLLPQPVYVYGGQSDVLWGGVFAFTMATDPEAFLILEARQDGEGAKWTFCFARMTGKRLEASLDSRMVWSVERAALWEGAFAYYFCVHAAVVPTAAEEADQ